MENSEKKIVINNNVDDEKNIQPKNLIIEETKEKSISKRNLMWILITLLILIIFILLYINGKSIYKQDFWYR